MKISYTSLLKGRIWFTYIKKIIVPSYEKKFSLTIVLAGSFKVQHSLFILSSWLFFKKSFHKSAIFQVAYVFLKYCMLGRCMLHPVILRFKIFIIWRRSVNTFFFYGKTPIGQSFKTLHLDLKIHFTYPGICRFVKAAWEHWLIKQ